MVRRHSGGVVMVKWKAVNVLAVSVMAMFWVASAEALSSETKASDQINTLVGVIRWDAWCHDANTNGVGSPYVGQQVERALGPSQYHYRVPFFGRVTGTNSVSIDGRKQSIMDQEIAYAKEAGISYWAFLYYPDNSGMDYARNLYNASSRKNDVKACYILSGDPGSAVTAWLVARFREPNYQKVLGSRPLLYLYSKFYKKAAIDALRNAATGAGVANPYIVVMDSHSLATTLGADAVSDYNCWAFNAGNYSPFILNADQNNWNRHKNAGKKVIPCVTAALDARPRIDNPVSWMKFGPREYVIDSTPEEIASNLRNALNFVVSHQEDCEANTVLIYAWNEHDEGGYLCPTLGSEGAADTSRLDAVKSVIQEMRVSP